MNLAVTILGLAVNTVLLVLVTRRLLGVPVGWVRTLVVSALITAGTGALLSYAGTELGLVTAEDRIASGVSLGVALGMLVLLIAWGVALGMGVLVVLEALVPTGSLPSPVAVLRDLPARRRRGRRYAEVVRIAVDHGLGGFLRAGSRLPDEGDHERWGRRLRQAFSAGGVTFVKLGQMLGTRPDLIGPGLARELGKLQADTPAEPWPGIERTLRRELGSSWRDRFASVDEQPLAAASAASVGQVHAAVLSDGRPVVLKVQRERAEAQVRADLDILLRMARWLDRTTAWGSALGCGPWRRASPPAWRRSWTTASRPPTRSGWPPPHPTGPVPGAASGPRCGSPPPTPSSAPAVSSSWSGSTGCRCRGRARRTACPRGTASGWPRACCTASSPRCSAPGSSTPTCTPATCSSSAPRVPRRG